MARKNNLKVRRKKLDAVRERAEAQARQLEERKKRREEMRKEKMDVTSDSQPDEKRPLKRKAQRRLENEMARLARKGFKLVKPEDEEMDDGDRKKKRMRAASD